jgi:hypothetical protein
MLYNCGTSYMHVNNYYTFHGMYRLPRIHQHPVSKWTSPMICRTFWKSHCPDPVSTEKYSLFCYCVVLARCCAGLVSETETKVRAVWDDHMNGLIYTYIGSDELCALGFSWCHINIMGKSTAWQLFPAGWLFDEKTLSQRFLFSIPRSTRNPTSAPLSLLSLCVADTAGRDSSHREGGDG